MKKKSLLIFALILSVVMLAFSSCTKEGTGTAPKAEAAEAVKVTTNKALLSPEEVNRRYSTADILREIAVWQGEKVVPIVEAGDFSVRTQIGAVDLAFGEVINVMKTLGKKNYSTMAMELMERQFPWDRYTDHVESYQMTDAFSDLWASTDKQYRRESLDEVVSLCRRNGFELLDDGDVFADFTEFLMEERDIDSIMEYSRERVTIDVAFYQAENDLDHDACMGPDEIRAYGNVETVRQMVMWQGERMLKAVKAVGYDPETVSGLYAQSYRDMQNVLQVLEWSKLGYVALEHLQDAFPWSEFLDADAARALENGASEILRDNTKIWTRAPQALSTLRAAGCYVYSVDPLVDFAAFLKKGENSNETLLISAGELSRTIRDHLL